MTICTYSLEKCLFKSFLFSVGFLVFLLLSCEGLFYILDMSPLSDICFANNFSHSFLMLSIETQKFLFFYLLIQEWGKRETDKEREKHQFVVPLIYAFIGWYLYVPWPVIQPATLVYWDNALTDWDTQPGHKSFSFWFIPMYLIFLLLLMLLVSCTKNCWQSKVMKTYSLYVFF